MATITKDKNPTSKKRTIKQKKKYKSRSTNDIYGVISRLTKNKSIKLKELTKNSQTKAHDLLFLDAKKYIDNDKNFKDACDIYMYLLNNNYNKENISKWLLYNSPEYGVRTYVFNKLIKDGQITDEDKLKVYIDMLSKKSKYNFDMNNYENVINKVNDLMHNENLCNKIDLMQINYYSDFSSNQNWLNHIKYFCNAIQPYNTIFQATLGNINPEKLDNLGIYVLYSQSPAFKHSIEVISFLSELVPIILYVDGTEIDTKYDKYIKDKTNLKIELVGGKSDDEVSNLMKSNNHIFLIFIYGLFIRRNVVLEHPAKYTFHYLEVINIYSKKIYDFNIIDKYMHGYLSEYQDIENDFGLVKLDSPIHMTPVCNICDISRPIYNPEQIKIGLILSECKLCNKTINIINKILAKNNKIYLTIYAFCDKTWLFSNFNKKYHSRIELKSYDNHNYMNELQNNLLYIDTILHSGHSTAMAILKSSRPLFAFKNKSKLFGIYSSTVIQHIDMCDELCADTEDKYVELVLHHLQNETNYMVLYNQFIYQLHKSNILDNSKYAEELYNKLNELYKSLTNTFISNYTPTDAEIPKKNYDIIYSYTAHEHHDSMFDTLNNLFYFNKKQKILAIIHPNNELYKPLCDAALDNINGTDIIINSNFKDKKWWTFDIMEAQMENFEYCQKNGIYSKYFIPLASNCIFKKDITLDNIQSILNTRVSVKDFIATNYDYTVFIELNKNQELINILEIQGYSTKLKTQHEGMILKNDDMKQIAKIIRELDIKSKITRDIPFEEILPISIYAKIHDKIPQLICKLYTDNQNLTPSRDDIINQDLPCFKRISRDYNDETRIWLRNTNNNYNIPKIHFISFFSEGPPFDNGLDLKETEKNVNNLINGCLDTFTAYHPKDFADDPEFAWSIQDWSKTDEKYTRPDAGWWSPMMNKFADVNKGCDKTGFYAWKAACIIKKMREIPDGDIVFFHDGNFDKYKNYYEGKDKCKTLIHTILNKIKCDVFIPWEQNSNCQLIRQFSRRQTFEKVGEFTDYYTKYNCLWSGLIIMRKSDFSRTFLDDMVIALKDIDNISNFPPDNSPELQWHTWDQPVWTILARKYIKENKLPEKWPYFYFPGRIFTKENMLIADHVKDVMNNIS